jgi:hypothetical protein
MKEITLREWVEKWNAGKFLSSDRKTQIAAGWYDWFCEDESLGARLVKFGQILRQVTNDFLLDNYYVWFKNNCPASDHPLYDDMRFEPMDESLRDSHYFLIAVDDMRESHKYVVITAKNDYEPEFRFSNSQEVVKFLNNWNF